MPKQPQDHKKKTEPFIWEAPNGGEVTLTPFNRLPFGLFRKSRNLSDEERTYMMLEAATDADGLAIIDELPMADIDGLFEAWANASGVELPQS